VYIDAKGEFSLQSSPNLTSRSSRSDGHTNHPILTRCYLRRCGTCGLKYRACPGHFGHIELSVPVYNPLVFTSVFSPDCPFTYLFVLTPTLSGRHFLIARDPISSSLRFSALKSTSDFHIRASLPLLSSVEQFSLLTAGPCTSSYDALACIASSSRWRRKR
jgi:hypothetical protein